MNIYLIDNVNDGHHDIYEKTLLTIKGTISCNMRRDFIDFKINFIKAINERKKFILDIKKEAKEIIHLLYLDSLYKTPWLIKDLSKKNKLIATLHWYPKRKIDMTLLKISSKYLEYIVVHSDYIKSVLNKNNIKNVVVIEYPSFYEKSNLMEHEFKIVDKNVIVSCIGGTRFDKGLNILIESFKYLSNESKKNYLFNIVGKEEDIKYDDLITEARVQGIKIQFINRMLSNGEYWDNVAKSDIILLPYTNEFRGNSGPMTDGAYLGKFILSSDRPSLKYLVDKYKLGACFESENSLDLANKLDYICRYKFNKDIVLNDNFSKEKFINNYESLYKKVNN